MPTSWILYDASCLFCVSCINSLKKTLEKQNCKIKPLQNKTISKILNIKGESDFPEMKIIGEDRKLYGGARGIIYISKNFWWTYPFWAIAHLPLTMNILDYIYKQIAKRRHCHGTCKIK